MTKYVMGIDGGGTKTTYTIADLFGNIVYSNTEGTFHYLQIGLEGLKTELKKCVKTSLEQSDITTESIEAIFVGCPGYGDITKDTPLIDKAIHEALIDFNVQVGNDTDNALEGALAGQPGINIIAGTGSIGLGIDSHMSRYKAGGWSHYFGGDEGSAYWIASKLALAFTQQADNRTPRTLLYNYIMETLGFDDSSGILTLLLNDYSLDRDKVASLSVHASTLASMGDPIALKIFEEAAFELSKVYISIYENLNFDLPVKASYTGGVFKSGNIILDPLRKYLKDYSIELNPPIYEPDIGSILAALKYANVKLNSEILNNLNNS